MSDNPIIELLDSSYIKQSRRNVMSQILKMPHKTGGSYTLTIDAAIVKELGITKDSIFSQEVVGDNAILMKIRKLAD